jgi:hypothetical protein
MYTAPFAKKQGCSAAVDGGYIFTNDKANGTSASLNTFDETANGIYPPHHSDKGRL